MYFDLNIFVLSIDKNVWFHPLPSPEWSRKLFIFSKTSGRRPDGCPDAVRTPPTIQESSDAFLQKGKDKCKSSSVCNQYQNIIISKSKGSDLQKKTFFRFKARLKFLKLWRRPDGVRTPPTIQETSEGFLQKGKDKCKICSVYSIPKYYDLNVCGNGFSKKKLFSSLERERNFWKDKGVRTPSGHLDVIWTPSKIWESSMTFLTTGECDWKIVFVCVRWKYYDLSTYQKNFLFSKFLDY